MRLHLLKENKFQTYNHESRNRLIFCRNFLDDESIFFVIKRLDNTQRHATFGLINIVSSCI